MNLLINSENNKILFFITGTVVSGNQIGRTIGIPTANLDTSDDITYITPGVYAVTAEVQGELHKGISHIGSRPTVEKDINLMVETHIFDFDCDLYGKALLLYGHRFLRPTKDFNSLTDLKSQIEIDIANAKAFFSDSKSTCT